MKNNKKFKFIFILALLPIFILLTCIGCRIISAGQETIGETSLGGQTKIETTVGEAAAKEIEVDGNTIAEMTTTEKTSGENQLTDDSGTQDTGNTVDGIGESQRYAVISSGISNDSQHYEWFLNSTNMAYELLNNNGYQDKNIYYLFESDKEPNVDYEATISNFKKVIGELQEKTTESDTILLFLIGHGTSSGKNSYYGLNDYNLSDVEMEDMFKSMERDKLIFVFSPCNSGGFIDDLSDKNTIVITSTQKNETNRAAFIEPFLTSFNGIGDANSDGKVSFAEAFNYAGSNVINQYSNNNWGAVTEHAQLDDNGDKLSHEAPVPNGDDGQIAEETFLK